MTQLYVLLTNDISMKNFSSLEPPATLKGDQVAKVMRKPELSLSGLVAVGKFVSFIQLLCRLNQNAFSITPW